MTMMKEAKFLIVCSFALAASACETEAWHRFTEPFPPTAAEVGVSADLAALDRRLTELEKINPDLSRKAAVRSENPSPVGELSARADDHGGRPITKVAEERNKEGGGDPGPAKSRNAKAQSSHNQKAPGFMAASAPTDCVSGPGCADASRAKGSFAVHLASYKHMKYLERGWTELQKRFPVLLANQVPRAKRYTGDDGTAYIRLKAGPFETRKQAKDLCNKLKEKQLYCALSRFDGIDLDGFVDL